ncbi:hypothetical protein D3C85_985500 [compost metagenome]
MVFEGTSGIPGSEGVALAVLVSTPAGADPGTFPVMVINIRLAVPALISALIRTLFPVPLAPLMTFTSPSVVTDQVTFVNKAGTSSAIARLRASEGPLLPATSV